MQLSHQLTEEEKRYVREGFENDERNEKWDDRGGCWGYCRVAVCVGWLKYGITLGKSLLQLMKYPFVLT